MTGKRQTLPPAAQLHELLLYQPETGKFFWKPRSADIFAETSWRPRESSAKAWNTLYAGKETMNMPTTNGYLAGQIFKTRVMAHRVAWAMANGRWPVEIDHINSIRTDNRLSNLREVTRSQNNVLKSSPRKDQYRGVYKNRHRWVSYINIDRRSKYLGSFATPEEAAKAFDAAAYAQHGQFARLNFPNYIAITQDAVARLRGET